MLIRRGADAPSFALAASDGSRVSLPAVLLQQQVLLLFYPGNDTPG